MKTVETTYGGRLAELDFARAPEASRATINQWIENETGQKIKDLLPAGTITTDTLLILTNAIYFKADWLEQFTERLTKQAGFTLASGRKITAPLMGQARFFEYLEESDYQALQMRYAGEELAMVLILPRREDGLAAIEKSLTAEKVSATLSKLSWQKVIVRIPRFKLIERLELSELLSYMGMPLASPCRQISRACPRPRTCSFRP